MFASYAQHLGLTLQLTAIIEVKRINVKNILTVIFIQQRSVIGFAFAEKQKHVVCFIYLTRWDENQRDKGSDHFMWLQTIHHFEEWNQLTVEMSVWTCMTGFQKLNGLLDWLSHDIIINWRNISGWSWVEAQSLSWRIFELNETEIQAFKAAAIISSWSKVSLPM